jgi:hypothetical protein
MTAFRLQFSASEIPRWAARYSYPDDDDIENRVAPAARARGFLTRNEFLAICRWKTPRSQPRCARNRDAFIAEVTRIALAAQDGEIKIRSLLLLSGVSWATASVILHFCDQGRHPILDYRALWSLGLAEPPDYTYDFWLEYGDFVRGIADRTNLAMRAIDRALWQYSKENQAPGKS